MSTLSRSVRRKSLGVAFLVVLTGLLWLSILFYQHAFTTVVPVSLHTGRIGHQLIVPADVKLRGIIVGQVRGVHSDGQEAVLDLALEPDKVKLIPANVLARILPKTLFGEKFVDLVIPPDPQGTLQPHAVISLDRSATAIEAEKVFNDLVPLLRTLQPVQLNLTLTNLATALAGRGNELGDNLVRADAYFRGLNPDLGNIEADISGLADLASNLDAATPDLLASARQFSVNASTLVAKSDVFAAFLEGTRGFADEATAVLTQNETNLVTLAAISRPNLSVLARYSPEFTCLLQGLTKVEPILNQTFKPTLHGSKPALHIELEVIAQPAGYTYPANRPTYTLSKDPRFSGPHCYGLPSAPTQPVAAPNPVDGTPASQVTPADEATQLARVLAAPELGVSGSQVPDLVAILTAPQLGGATVSLR